MKDNMKTALITGSTKGIGLEIAKELAALGFHIYLSGRNEKAGKKETEKLVRSGASVEFVSMDIADLNSIRSAFSFISKDCKKLDVLINNAAVQPDSGLSIEKVPAGIIHEVVNINILGAIFVTQGLYSAAQKGKPCDQRFQYWRPVVLWNGRLGAALLHQQNRLKRDHGSICKSL